MDRNEKVWAWANTGTKMHAFVQGAGLGRVRAMCRKNIERGTNAAFYGRDDKLVVSVCTRCEILANAMWDRAETSMEPATEADDLGYVAPAGKFTDMQRDSMQDAFDAAVASAQVLKTDTLHAEALEMDAAGEALTQVHAEAMTLLERSQPVCWHYRAHVMTYQGAFLGVVEGYLTATEEADVERRVRKAYDGGPQRTLGNFNITPAR